MAEWQMPATIEQIGERTRCCWNCMHCMRWTATPGSWVGRCMEKRSGFFPEYIWLERDSCGYFELRTHQ